MPLEPREIGRRIADARQARGWTQRVLAENVGVDVRTVSRWENGNPPQVQVLVDISRMLDVPIDYLADVAPLPTEDRLDRIEGMLLVAIGLLRDLAADEEHAVGEQHPPASQRAG